MVNKILRAGLVLLVILTAIGCNRDPEEPTEEEILNEWIWGVMNEFYLWNDEIDQSLYPTESDDPEAFFYSILYEEDIFSWIVDDYEALIASFNNVTLSSGISPYFIRKSDSEEVIAVAEYVVKGSPAELAGIKRGDIITKINGTVMNMDNYADLFYTEEQTLSFALFSDSAGLVDIDREVQITAEVIEENPVHHYEVIDYNSMKIGYLVYNGFSTGVGRKWIDSLDYALQDLQAEGIEELIIDLRYNPGGQETAVRHLASVISPSDVPGNDNILVSYEWNDLVQEFFDADPDEYAGNLYVLFEESVDYSLNLDDIYFLTSGHSASASELLIIGLEPYMNVIQIGEATYGKCYGSNTFPDTEKPPRHNWAMQPIIFKFSNAEGFTDFVDGIQPDVEIEDDILNALPFGDLEDPLIAQALQMIAGIGGGTKKSSSPAIEPLPDPVREKRMRYSKAPSAF